MLDVPPRCVGLAIHGWLGDTWAGELAQWLAGARIAARFVAERSCRIAQGIISTYEGTGTVTWCLRWAEEHLALEGSSAGCSMEVKERAPGRRSPGARAA